MSTADGSWQAPGHRVPVVDSIGAGDAFTSGYLSALLDEPPMAERLERGNACGAFAVATSGDWEGLPTRAELGLAGAGGRGSTAVTGIEPGQPRPSSDVLLVWTWGDAHF